VITDICQGKAGVNSALLLNFSFAICISDVSAALCCIYLKTTTGACSTLARHVNQHSLAPAIICFN